MEIGVISDTHWERNPVRSFPPADLYLCAGDIGTPLEKAKMVSFFRSLSASKVIWVPGNHEYSYQTLAEARRRMQEISDLAGITLLDRASTEFHGLPIYGATLWSDSENSEMPDLQRIFDFDLEIRNRLHWQDREFLLGAPEGSLVVSHHAPSYHGLATEHWKSSKNDIYANRFERHLRNWEGTWIFGHTHHQVKFQLGQCQLFSNPIGHLSEKLKSWANPCLILS